MKKLRVLGVLTCLLASRAELASAQYHFLYWPSGDSIALRPGASTNAIITMYTYTPSIGPNLGCTTTTAYDLTLQFVQAEVQVTSVATANDYTTFATPSLTLAPGQATIASTGSAGYPYACYVTLAQVRFTLDPGSTQGAVVHLQANALNGYSGESLLPGLIPDPYPLRICHATKVWGDLDGNGSATSRDALVTLSAAVGLPITGFDDTVADVDGDEVITSRDALFILSAGLGFTDSNAGRGIADVCPPVVPAPPALLARGRGVAR